MFQKGRPEQLCSHYSIIFILSSVTWDIMDPCCSHCCSGDTWPAQVHGLFLPTAFSVEVWIRPGRLIPKLIFINSLWKIWLQILLPGSEKSAGYRRAPCHLQLASEYKSKGKEPWVSKPKLYFNYIITGNKKPVKQILYNSNSNISVIY